MLISLHNTFVNAARFLELKIPWLILRPLKMISNKSIKKCLCEETINHCALRNITKKYYAFRTLSNPEHLSHFLRNEFLCKTETFAELERVISLILRGCLKLFSLYLSPPLIQTEAHI